MNQLIKSIIEKQIKSLPIINKFTCTFLKDLTNYKVEGTGVFIKLGNLHLLVSAAHVFDNFSELFIPIRSGIFLIKPGGELIINNPKTVRKEDELDIGILILDEQSVQELRNDYNFVPEQDILINHKQDYLNNYIVYGYPSTWSKKSFSRNSFHSRPFINFTKAIKIDSPHQHLKIFVEYNRKETINLKSKRISYGPNLYGISGCGLWYLNPTEYNQDKNPKLVGIMTDWSIKDRRILNATRIDTVTELLRNKKLINFPETKLFGFK